MKPSGHSPPEGHDPDGLLSKEDLESLATPISVVYGYTQLLQRRIRNGRTIDTEDLLRVLGLMDQASRQLTMQLMVLRNRSRRPEADDEPGEGPR